MKKAFFFIMLLLSAFVAWFSWSATFTGIRSYVSWSLAGLQPRVNPLSIALLVVVSSAFTILAVVFFKAYKKTRRNK